LSTRKDSTGALFGLLVAQRRVGMVNRRSIWEFRCDCGNVIEYDISEVRRGHKSSCGCLKRGTLKTHGLYKTKAYDMWGRMKQSCYNLKHKCYKWIGARGIRVCPEWRDDPVAFCKWATAEGADEPGTYLTRLDKNKDYCPENCVVLPRGFFNGAKQG